MLTFSVGARFHANVLRTLAGVSWTHHGSEELPVSEVHAHLLLQLVDVTLRQNSAVDVRLKTKTKNDSTHRLVSLHHQ